MGGGLSRGLTRFDFSLIPTEAELQGPGRTQGGQLGGGCSSPRTGGGGLGLGEQQERWEQWLILHEFQRQNGIY